MTATKKTSAWQEMNRTAAQRSEDTVVAPSRPVISCNCPRCNTANLSDRRFCAGCGAAIWEACLGCGTENLAGEKFCGQCGQDLAALVKVTLDKLEQAEMLAQTHHIAHRYSDALSVLNRIAVRPHPRLSETQERLRELADQIRRELSEKESRIGKNMELAGQRLDVHDYEGALALLKEIPASLRTVEIAELVDEVAAKHREVASLSAEIRQRMADKRFAGLLAVIDRLLELQPNHGPVTALRAKLQEMEDGDNERRRGTLVESATKKLNAFQYGAALAQLEQVVPNVRTPQVEKMLEFAREADWLDRALREAARLGEHLLPLARRLQKIRPGDPRATRLIAELEQPSQAAPDGPLAALLQRQSQPQKSQLFGCPLAPLSGFQRIALSPEVVASSLWREHDTNWGVAAGLALQALGQASISLNLKPQDKNLMRKLLTTSLMKKPPRVAWGIELGRSALKAVRLSWNSDTSQAFCEAVDFVEYETPLGAPGASPEKLIGDAVQAFASRHKLKEIPLAISLDGREVFSRFLKTPPVSRDRLDDLVQYEAKNQIPYDLSQFSWSYAVQGNAGEAAEDFTEFPVMILAAKRAQLDVRLAAFQQLKLPVDLVQCDSVALHNFLVYDRAAPAVAIDESLSVILDVGAETSNFILSRPGFFWVRNMAIGGADFTKGLIHEFKLTFAQAELQKRSPATATRLHKLFEALDPAAGQLISQTQHSLRAFENLQPGSKIRQAWVHGDTLRLHGLLEQLL
ncbi:MAG: pilus assembly protein PilM [Pirellulales bacterium]